MTQDIPGASKNFEEREQTERDIPRSSTTQGAVSSLKQDENEEVGLVTNIFMELCTMLYSLTLGCV